MRAELPSPNPRTRSERWRPAALAVLLALQAACVPDESPGIRACQAGRKDLRVVSRGTLAVLPSAAEGVEVDSGAWLTVAHPVEFGAVSFLVLSSRLVPSRRTNIGELGLIYRMDGDPAPPPIVDVHFGQAVYSIPMEQWKPAAPEADGALASGRTARTEWAEKVEVGVATSRWLPFSGCPASVQVVRRRDLALRVGSGAAWAALPADRLRMRARQAGVSGVGVVWDTTFNPQPWSAFVAGVVANVSGDTARGRAVRLVVSGRLNGPAGAGSSRTPPAFDTLTYPLPAMPPGSVAGFASRPLEDGERLVSLSAVALGRTGGRSGSMGALQPRALETTQVRPPVGRGRVLDLP